MKKIDTRDFGETEVEDSAVFSFPNGVYAFEEEKEFALLSPLGAGIYPMWLQSTNNSSLCFIVFDPELIDEGFTVVLNESERRLLDIQDDSEIRCLVIAKVPENYKETTVNMKSPIVINSRNNRAIQVILPMDYPFRLPIYTEEVG